MNRAALLPWPSPEADALLGTMADVAVSRRVRAARSTVARRRQRLGVAAYRWHDASRWGAAMEALDTAHTVGELAATLGCGRKRAGRIVRDLARHGRVVSLGDGLWVAA